MIIYGNNAIFNIAKILKNLISITIINVVNIKICYEFDSVFYEEVLTFNSKEVTENVFDRISKYLQSTTF